VRILAIDGGGIRGIIPAMVLAEIERRTGRRTTELFDLVAGTSTGGILACALAVPSPRFSAAELVELYTREGPGIFRRSLGKRISSVEGLLEEKYDAEPLRAALGRYLGPARLRDATTPLLITAYELERRTPFFFRSQRALVDPDYDFPMVDVAHATSAAPTYWEPVRLGPYALVDGGVYAGNPAMCGWAEAKDPEAVVISLGCGLQSRPIHYRDAKGWGLVEWARPIIDVVLDGSSHVVEYQLEQVAGAARYVRLQITLEMASDELDDASEENLVRLQREGERLLVERAADVDKAVALLT